MSVQKMSRELEADDNQHIRWITQSAQIGFLGADYLSMDLEIDENLWAALSEAQSLINRVAETHKITNGFIFNSKDKDHIAWARGAVNIETFGFRGARGDMALKDAAILYVTTRLSMNSLSQHENGSTVDTVIDLTMTDADTSQGAGNEFHLEPVKPKVEQPENGSDDSDERGENGENGRSGRGAFNSNNTGNPGETADPAMANRTTLPGINFIMGSADQLLRSDIGGLQDLIHDVETHVDKTKVYPQFTCAPQSRPIRHKH